MRNFRNTDALDLIKQLLHLLKLRAQLSSEDADQLNYYNFRIAVSMQDMAQVKLELGNSEDALLHLIESEKKLLSI